MTQQELQGGIMSRSVFCTRSPGFLQVEVAALIDMLLLASKALDE